MVICRRGEVLWENRGFKERGNMKDNISAFDAAEYDDKIKMTIPFYEDFYRQVIEVVKSWSDGPVRWLDVGCGTGKMAEAAFEKFAPYSEAGESLYLKRWKAYQISQGKSFDWGRTSDDYAKYRDIYPKEFYENIIHRKLCISGQNVLDLGTGTGVLPRNMYQYGAKWKSG